MLFLSKKQVLLIGGGILALIVVGAIFVLSIREEKTAKRVTLEVWGTEDDDVFESLARSYSDLQTNVAINYTQISESNYDARLISALASGRGPDVFFVRSHSLPVDLISTAPETQFTYEELTNLFPKVVWQDFAPGEKVYALPLYLDTLAMVYNQNIFNRVGVVDPPRDWDSFEDLISDLKVLDDDGRVKKAGAAIGGSDRSINNASEVLQMLLLQNGAEMIDERGRASFSEGTRGVSAFDFYTKFGDPSDIYFTWDDSGKNAADSFAAEETVIIFTYKSKINELKAKNPFLEMGVAPVPQVSADNPITFADYHGLAVSKQSREQAWAWDFIIKTTTGADLARAYSKSSGRPPALRSIISENLRSSEYGIFARQALIAKSWYFADHKRIKEALSQAIQKKIVGAADSKTALQQAQNQISEIIRENTAE